MTQSGAYAPQAVNEVDLQVIVNGTVYPVSTISWGGDTTGGLPGAVVSAGTGMRSRTGQITWAAEGVEGTAPHPLRRKNGWPPSQGDSLQIDATVNGVTFRRFTGRIGRTTGSMVDGTLTSTFTDLLADRLGQNVTIPPRLSRVYDLPQRVAYEALESVGLGLLPYPDDNTVVHASLQGTAGTIIGVDSDIYSSEAEERFFDPYGIECWSNLPTGAADLSPAGRPILVIARGSTTTDSSVTLKLTNGNTARLDHRASDGRLQLYFNSTLGLTETYFGQGVPILAFTLSFGTMRVWLSPTQALTVAVSGSAAGRVESIDGTCIAGMHARYIDALDGVDNDIVRETPAWPTSMTRNSILPSRSPAFRGYQNTPAADVLEEFTNATLASCWMDEFGRPEVVHRETLLAGGTARVLNVDEKVFAGSWSLGEDPVYSAVVIKGQRPVVAGAEKPETPFVQRNYGVPIAQDGSIQGADEATITQRFVEAAPEEDWGPIHTTNLFNAGGTSIGSELHGSWSGGVVVPANQSNTGVWWHTLSGMTYDLVVERLGQRTLLLTETVGTPPAGGTFYSRFAESSAGTHSQYRNTPLPLLRAMWKSTWSDYATNPRRGGPAYAPTLDHDTGWWVHRSDAAALRDKLAAEVTKLMPTLTGVRVLWDPRRQTGDIETWYVRDASGQPSWQARLMVTGYDESWDDGVPTQTVNVRVLSMSDTTLPPKGIPTWGTAVAVLETPSWPQVSPWARRSGELIAPPKQLPSDWARAGVVLTQPLGPVASPWGIEPVLLTEPHAPMGVWDGTRIRYVPLETHEPGGAE